MWARVSTYDEPVDGIDEGIDYVNREIMPKLRQTAGFKGLYALADRSTGKTLSISLWESEDALRASEEAANRMRRDSTDAARGEILDVERFEVTLSETV